MRVNTCCAHTGIAKPWFYYPRDAMLARVFVTVTCLSVRPSRCLSHAGIVPSRAKAGSWNVHHLIAPWWGMIHRKIRKGSPQRNVPNEGGLGFSAIFDQYVVISRKRCILDTKLLWDGNRKPYARYRMVSLLMTLSDPWPVFQGHGSFKRRVSPKWCVLQTQLLYRT